MYVCISNFFSLFATLLKERNKHTYAFVYLFLYISSRIIYFSGNKLLNK